VLSDNRASLKPEQPKQLILCSASARNAIRLSHGKLTVPMIFVSIGVDFTEEEIIAGEAMVDAEVDAEAVVEGPVKQALHDENDFDAF
jgi:hypothetical protein